MSAELQSWMVETERTFRREEHLRHFVVWPGETDAHLGWLLVAPRVESDCHFVNEAAITRIEKVSEVLAELLENQLD